jgi:hypothetical protein
LSVGEATKTPLELDSAYAVARRVATDDACPEAPLHYELPTPRVASLTLIDDFVRSSQPEQLGYSLARVAGLVSPLLGEQERSVTEAIWRELAEAFKVADTPDKRVNAYQTALSSLQRTLSEARYAQVTETLQRWVSAELVEIDRP